MISCDNRGLKISSTEYAAVEAYCTGVDLMLSLWPGATEALKLAIELDPEFALAYAALARQHAILAQIPEAKNAITRAKALVARRGTEREVSHVEVLGLAIEGQAKRALAAALEHIDRWPRDVLVFGLPLGAFGLLAFSGMADHDQARVALCERYARSFTESDWWFLTYRGWSHAENGDVVYGRSLTASALEQRRNNANGAHAFVHVLHENGESSEALAFISDWLPGYDRSAILHGHIAWHGALAALEQGEPESAMDWYDHHVAPSVSAGTPVNIVSDSASFLWRFQAYGHEVPAGRWQDASDYAANYFQQPGFPFADIHMAMIAAATGNDSAVEHRVQILERLVRENGLPAGPVVPALCRAVLAFMNGNYRSCTQLLETFAVEAVRVGGSGAQREIIEDTLLLSLIRQGEVGRARSLLERRLHRRNSTRDARWLKGLPPLSASTF